MNSQKSIKELKEAIKDNLKKDKPLKNNSMKKFLILSGLMVLVTFSLIAQAGNEDFVVVGQVASDQNMVQIEMRYTGGQNICFISESPVNPIDQIMNDHDAILKLSLQVSEMIPGNHSDNTGKTVLAITDNGKVNKSTSITWFGNKILFVQTGEMKTRGIVAWIEFENFSVGGDSANVSLLYKIESSATTKIELTFSKSAQDWLITSKKTTFI